MEELMFVQHDNFERQKQRLFRGGPGRLKILADFDRTLTTNFIHGRKAPSLIASLRDGNYLSSDYAAKAQALHDYYQPFEDDNSLSLESKSSLMMEWWQRHFELLIASGLRQKDIVSVIDEHLANLRNGVSEFLSLLSCHKIPLIIFSASGLGRFGLKYFLTRRGLWTDNIFLVANDFIWDEQGRAIGVCEPIIHSCNKNQSVLSFFNVDEAFKKRDNILLLGDSLGDAAMVDGMAAAAVLKIGFLNDKIRESLPAYRALYDVLILNDGDFALPLSILKDLLTYVD
ncbi:MAG TPA: hypothetical protein PKK65_02280 [bacterium]|nr:hypothetical protein [bacterium]HQQ38189.1 hypothetical protein [bacterium]